MIYLHKMEKKILIINGHPDRESFNYVLHEAYKESALSVKKLNPQAENPITIHQNDENPISNTKTSDRVPIRNGGPHNPNPEET
ncbi:hypothetical protein FACS189413_01250 [Bacteroidia bacterium]|nr:hypothetical protein FACS189413_01250 [Bacteroidia bacterium]